MIKVNDNNYYFAEVLIRQSASEALTSALLARSITVGGTQFVKTFTPSNINDYLYTVQGKPTYNVAAVGGSISFTTSLDIAYMNSGVSCRSISGDLRTIDTNYTANTNKEKYVFVCNFTGVTPISITLNKLSHGYYQTTFTLRISCGNNYEEWTVSGNSGSFSVSYNGSAYVASCKVGSKTYSVTSQNCRQQASRLELAGSSDCYSLAGGYSGIYNMKGEITTGMARY